MQTHGLSVERIRDDFPILKREIHGHPLVYLDSASTTLKPKPVIETLSQHYLMETSNIHRGIHFLSEEATKAYEGVRAQVKTFLHTSDGEVVFTRGTTESINLVANSYGRHFFKEGAEIIVSHMEHHSNIVPWQLLCEAKGCKLKVIPINDRGELEMDAYRDAFNTKTAMVSMVHISNSLGTVNPVKKIVETAHYHHVPVLIDGAQAISNRRIDLDDLGCDFFVFSSHKIFGPTGVGALVVKSKILETMPPWQGGGT